MSVLVISFDSVGDAAFESMAADGANYPNIARFKQEGYYQGGVKTVFMSNTYPVHTSVATGKLPKDHGIISNLLPPKENGERPWAQMARLIKTKTIWDAAREKNLSTASIFWPVTCGAKIDYHMPEVHPERGQNMLLCALRYGSVLFQVTSLLKRGRLLVKALKSMARRGSGQPYLDTFTAAVTCDLLKRRKPALALVHLLAYDAVFHSSGSEGKELDMAKKTLDASLGRILESSSFDTVIVFSDHSQLDIHQNINLKDLYPGAVFEQTGGSAFLNQAIPGLEEEPWFARYLTKEEMRESGYSDKPVLGIAAKRGCVFTEGKQYKGNHGYPADYENYSVFYCVRGRNFEAGGQQLQLKKHITDVTAIIARELDLDMDILDEYGMR